MPCGLQSMAMDGVRHLAWLRGMFSSPPCSASSFFLGFLELCDESPKPPPSGSEGSGVATTDSQANPQLPPCDGSSTLLPSSHSSFVGANPVMGANPQSAYPLVV